MITKVTAHNDKLYDDLFADISEHVVKITTLEEYFQNIQAIGAYAKAHTDKAYYMRLPADENFFEINANTRMIAVPDTYRRSGIAIAGDTYAETLWFKIDRYYDLQDLGETNIRIYWELPDIGKTAGYSTPVFRDINSEARYLIFGWVIPDILTEYAGDIKFYISFYRELDDENVYTFNTLPQSVKIGNTLNLKNKNPKVDDTSEDTIVNRLRNTVNMGGVYVGRPVFSSLTTAYDAPNSHLLTEDNGGVDIYVSAYSENSNATITYVLYRNGILYSTPSEVVYNPTLDETINPQKVYYNSVGDVLDITAEGAISLAHEKCYKFRITEAGSYQCKAVAKLMVNNVEVNSAPAYTMMWVWEEPTDFEVSVNNFKFTSAGHKGVISGAANDGSTREIKIVWPRHNNESVQQQSAIYTATIEFDDLTAGEAPDLQILDNKGTDKETVAMIDYPFGDELGKGYVQAKFTKSLNKESKENDTIIRLPIQSPAKSYTGTISGLGQLIQVDSGYSNVSIDRTAMIEGQEYFYVWAYSSIANGEYSPVTSQQAIPEGNIIDSFSRTGYYKLRIISVYGHDTKTKETSDYLTVYSIG